MSNTSLEKLREDAALLQKKCATKLAELKQEYLKQKKLISNSLIDQEFAEIGISLNEDSQEISYYQQQINKFNTDVPLYLEKKKQLTIEIKNIKSSILRLDPTYKFEDDSSFALSKLKNQRTSLQNILVFMQEKYLNSIKEEVNQSKKNLQSDYIPYLCRDEMECNLSEVDKKASMMDQSNDYIQQMQELEVIRLEFEYLTKEKKRILTENAELTAEIHCLDKRQPDKYDRDLSIYSLETLQNDNKTLREERTRQIQLIDEKVTQINQINNLAEKIKLIDSTYKFNQLAVDETQKYSLQELATKLLELQNLVKVKKDIEVFLKQLENTISQTIAPYMQKLSDEEKSKLLSLVVVDKTQSIENQYQKCQENYKMLTSQLIDFDMIIKQKEALLETNKRLHADLINVGYELPPYPANLVDISLDKLKKDKLDFGSKKGHFEGVARKYSELKSKFKSANLTKKETENFVLFATEKDKNNIKFYQEQIKVINELSALSDLKVYYLNQIDVLREKIAFLLGIEYKPTVIKLYEVSIRELEATLKELTEQKNKLSAEKKEYYENLFADQCKYEEEVSKKTENDNLKKIKLPFCVLAEMEKLKKLGFYPIFICGSTVIKLNSLFQSMGEEDYLFLKMKDITNDLDLVSYNQNDILPVGEKSEFFNRERGILDELQTEAQKEACKNLKPNLFTFNLSNPNPQVAKKQPKTHLDIKMDVLSEPVFALFNDDPVAALTCDFYMRLNTSSSVYVSANGMVIDLSAKAFEHYHNKMIVCQHKDVKKLIESDLSRALHFVKAEVNGYKLEDRIINAFKEISALDVEGKDKLLFNRLRPLAVKLYFSCGKLAFLDVLHKYGLLTKLFGVKTEQQFLDKCIKKKEEEASPPSHYMTSSPTLYAYPGNNIGNPATPLNRYEKKN